MKRTFFALGLIVAIFCASVGLYFGIFKQADKLKRPAAIAIDEGQFNHVLLDKPEDSQSKQMELENNNNIENQSETSAGKKQQITGSGALKQNVVSKGSFLIDGKKYKQTIYMHPDGKSAAAGVVPMQEENELE